MDEQIEQAVAIALSPSSDQILKSQAMNFCEQVKASPDGWQLCLLLFVRFPKSSPEARLFALQVVDEVLKNGSLDTPQFLQIRSTLMEFVKREYVLEEVNGVEFSSEPQYLKNKFSHTLTLLFVQLYPSLWPNFFDEFLALLQINAINGSKTNVRTIDIFLRILLSIDEEVANLSVPRKKEDAQRNTAIKDFMRRNDVQKLATAWYDMLKDYCTRNQDVAEMCLKIVGLYISWIDISLIVNESFITLLYQLLVEIRLRIAACECLAEIVCKGMKPLDKFELIQVLNLADVMRRLDLSDDIDFVEQVAKLTNALGVELCKIWEEVDSETKPAVYVQIELLLPFLLKFLADEYDDTSCAVFSFVSALQTVLKKQKSCSGALTGSQREFLDSLLKVVVLKMKYDDETDWGGTDDGAEDVAEFLEMRKSLKSFFEAIYHIDSQLFTTYIRLAVISTLDNYAKLGNALDWRELELALHLLHLYGEAIKGKVQFVEKHNNEITVYTSLGEMVNQMIQCDVSKYAHPAITLNFFENISRYSQFFEVQPDCIPPVLEAFVDIRGLHNPNTTIRYRSWYLFHRFIKLLKLKMDKYVNTVLGSIQDLLIIQAILDSSDISADSNPLTKDKAMESGFSEQIFLFETVGTLITIESIPQDDQLEFAKAIFNPLMEEIQRYMQICTESPEHIDPRSVLQLHHLIMAVGSIVKGFPESPKGSHPIIPWVGILKQATEIVLAVLKILNRYEIIRDAARYTFARLVSVLGTEILPYLPLLINELLTECGISELVDFLPFIGLLAHKFKPSIFNILNELIIPLIDKVFQFLNQAPSGTDEALLLIDLRKAYLNFILGLLNNEMDAVFVSELNQPRLESILRSVIHYASDLSDIPSMKIAFSILSKALTLWGDQYLAIGALYEHILRICFEVPFKPSFNVNDGQSLTVLNEISKILKIMLSQKGDDFLEYLRNVWTVWLLQPDLLDDFLRTLQQLELKAFQKYFQQFVKTSKS
ncbi:Xpo1-domain-containing protein [Gigaspora margarita]|uniref:Exportin-T n=1 Tax=Gigaspora margarita TaxID=4874 RepID=A0A8H4B0U9_GIGMA|nr:Xpo1-domain-containing protein [Gigaspora margarita]